MINGTPASQHSAQFNHGNHHKCEVCDCLITYPDSLMTKDLGYSVCRSFDCRRVMGQKSTMAPQMFKSHLIFNRKIIAQRRARDAERKKHMAEVEEKQRLENVEILQHILRQHPELSEENTRLLVIPSGGLLSTHPSHKRVNQYIDHLNGIVEEAAEYNCASELIYDEHYDAHDKSRVVEQRLLDNPQLRSVSDNLCTMCRGGCCASGKEHAYLSVFTMRTYLDNHLDISAEDLLDLYIDNIRNETIKDSCINHTSKGCALPRHLRSDICNGYYCDSLKSFQKNAEDTGSRNMVLAVQRSSHYWNRFEPGVENEVTNIALIGSQPNQLSHSPLSDFGPALRKS